MNKPHFILRSVKPKADAHLELGFEDGFSANVNLTDWLKTSRALKPLKDERVFMKAKIAAAGRCVEWSSAQIDLAADNLRNLAVEQAGGIGHERIWGWLSETGLTLEQAALALGISRRMLIYYRDGEKPIPRTIWLACLGWQAVMPKTDRLPHRLPTIKEYAAAHAG